MLRYSNSNLFSDNDFEVAQFVRGSTHDNPDLVDTEGFVYSKHKTYKDLVYWRCTKTSEIEGRPGIAALICNARATTEGDRIIHRRGDHRHPPSFGAKRKDSGDS